MEATFEVDPERLINQHVCCHNNSSLQLGPAVKCYLPAL